MLTRWMIIGFGVVGCAVLGGYIVSANLSMIGDVAREASPRLMASFANLVSVATVQVVKADQKQITQNEDSLEKIERHIDAEGVITMVIHEKDVNKILNEAVQDKLQGFVKNASVVVTKGNVEARVVVTRPIPGTIVTEGNIEVREGKLYPYITKVRYGFLPLPTSIVRGLVEKITNQKESREWIETPRFIWKSFELEEGKATISFKEKK